MTSANDSPSPCPPGLALLVLDMQPAFIRAMHNATAVERRCLFAIRTAVLLDIPVVFTEQVPDKLGPTAPDLRAAAPDAPVFTKTAFSALGAKGIETFITDNTVHHLLITGLEVPVCIYQTVLACIADDIEVTLLSDCIGSRRLEDEQAVLRSFSTLESGCHILPAESVFYSLLGAADHPLFRSYTQLVKEA